MLNNSYKVKNVVSNSNFKVQMAFLLSNVIWGAANPVIKFTLGYIPPLTFLFLRFLIVCIVSFPIAAYQLKKEPIDKKDLINFLLLGIFSQTSLVIPFIALEFTSSLDFTIIGVLGSVLTVYAGHYFYKEKINRKVTFGLIMASLGTIFIVLEPIFEGHSSQNSIFDRTLGNLLGLAYALVWVVYIIWSKYSMGERSTMMKKTMSFIHIRPMTKRYSATTIVVLSFYVGLITIVPLAILESQNYNIYQHFNITTIGFYGLLGLLYMALFSSMAAYFLNQWGLENAKVSNYAIYGYLSPVLTLPFAYLLLGEIPNLYMIIGSVLIAIGVIVAEKGNCSPC